MANPGFRRQGVGWGMAPIPEFKKRSYYFGKIFAENYMKMKEIGQGARVPDAPLDPPMNNLSVSVCVCI